MVVIIKPGTKVIVRDATTGQILQTKNVTTKDIAESTIKRRSRGAATPEIEASAVTTPLEGGGTITATRGGLVTVRDDQGRLVEQFQGDQTAVNQFISERSQQIPERTTRRVSETTRIRPGEGVFVEIGTEEETGEEIFKKEVLRRGETGELQRTGIEITPTGLGTLRSLQAQPVRQTMSLREQEIAERRARPPELTPEQQILASGGVFTPGGEIRAATPEQAKVERRARFTEQFIGSPFAAFSAPGIDVFETIATPERARGLTRQFLTTGTPAEQAASIAGLVSLVAVPARATPALSQAEFQLLSRVPSGVARFSAGIGLTTIESGIIAKLSTRATTATAPEEFRPFLEENRIFRQSLAEEQAAQPSFVRRTLGGVNIALDRSQLQTFQESARRQLEAEGFRGKELETGVEALTFRRQTAEPFGQALTTLNAGRFSEVFGRVQVSQLGNQLVGKRFRERVFGFGRAIAPAGFIEVRGEIAGQRARTGTDLPIIDPERPLANILPTYTKEQGLRFQTRLAEDIGVGAIGAATAATIGGLVGAGATAPTGASGRATRQTGRIAEIVGNIADVSEPFTDVLAGSAGVPSPRVTSLTFSAVPQFQPTPLISQTPTSSISQTLEQAFGVVPSAVPSITPTFVPSDVFTPSIVPSAVPSQVPSTIPEIVPSIIPADVPADVVVGVPAIVPSITPASVPVLSSVWRLPPPLPLDLSFGGGGMGGSIERDMRRYVNELQAGGVLLGSLTGGVTRRRSNNNRRRNNNNIFNQEFNFDLGFNLNNNGGGRRRRTRNEGFKLPFNIL